MKYNVHNYSIGGSWAESQKLRHKQIMKEKRAANPAWAYFCLFCLCPLKGTKKRPRGHLLGTPWPLSSFCFFVKKKGQRQTCCLKGKGKKKGQRQTKGPKG
jgi:hypothetical protein